MAETRTDQGMFLVDPEMRGIIPLDGFHRPRSLKKFMKRMTFDMSCNQAFAELIHECARQTPDRDETWINGGIEYLYTELHKQGHAHSIEIWDRDPHDPQKEPVLVGGLYGLSIGGAFFGESMFSRKTNASKVALVYLVEHLRARGYALLDTQFITDHLKRFGAIEIPRDDYKARLENALQMNCHFD